MDYIHDSLDFHTKGPSAVMLGKFDGLHLGHQKLLREILRLQKEGFYGIVFSIAPDRPMLLTPEEKFRALKRSGVDCLISCPFVPEILTMEPETFVATVLRDRLEAKYVVVGSDFRFGYRRSGDVHLLDALQEKYGYRLLVIPKECYEGREISSSYIREALKDGQMELIEKLMGEYYPVEGKVQHGRKLGSSIGIPTINLIPEECKLLPPPGVYFSEVRGEKFCCPGVSNIGYKPTVDGSFLGVETYLYGVSGDLYGCGVRVSVRSFLRPEQKFDSVEELKAQMERDILSGKEYFGVS